MAERPDYRISGGPRRWCAREQELFSWLKVAVVTDGVRASAFRKLEEDLSLNLQEKQAVVAEVSAQVAQAQTIVLAEYRGIQVGDITKLRANARKSGVYFHVLKNTLARRAVQGTPFETLADQMVGPLVYSISADAVAAAKVVHEFAKTNDKLVVKAGSYNGKVLDAAGVNALASVPSKEVLLAQLCGLLQSPVSGLARVLNAVAEKKEPAAA
jgi:large subunit ribosomal protein L10